MDLALLNRTAIFVKACTVSLCIFTSHTVHWLCLLLFLRRERSKVPYIVRQCIEEVEKRGIDEVGIYRISGVATDIQALKAAFDASKRLFYTSHTHPTYAKVQNEPLFFILWYIAVWLAGKPICKAAICISIAHRSLLVSFSSIRLFQLHLIQYLALISHQSLVMWGQWRPVSWV